MRVGTYVEGCIVGMNDDGDAVGYPLVGVSDGSAVVGDVVGMVVGVPDVGRIVGGYVGG